jgi:hypothetical protein
MQLITQRGASLTEAYHRRMQPSTQSASTGTIKLCGAAPTDLGWKTTCTRCAPDISTTTPTEHFGKALYRDQQGRAVQVSIRESHRAPNPKNLARSECVKTGVIAEAMVSAMALDTAPAKYM